MLDIEKAGSIDDLRTLHSRIQALVLHLSGTGIPIRDMVKPIANLNDQVLIRLIALLRADKYADLTDDFAFVVMGSEGRGSRPCPPTRTTRSSTPTRWARTRSPRLEAFSHELIEALISIGVPPCPGGIMAKNPPWRRSLSGWKMELNRWLSTPTPDNVMTGSMFMDLRALYGRSDLVRALKEHAFATLSEDQGFLMRMAQNMTNFLPPLGWFGKVKLEKSGPHRGRLDVKKAGIFAITDGVKALAIEAHALDGTTHDRIEALTAAGVIKPEDAKNLLASFDFVIDPPARPCRGATRRRDADQLRVDGHAQRDAAGRIAAGTGAGGEVPGLHQAPLPPAPAAQLTPPLRRGQQTVLVLHHSARNAHRGGPGNDRPPRGLDVARVKSSAEQQDQRGVVHPHQQQHQRARGAIGGGGRRGRQVQRDQRAPQRNSSAVTSAPSQTSRQPSTTSGSTRKMQANRSVTTTRRHRPVHPQQHETRHRQPVLGEGHQRLTATLSISDTSSTKPIASTTVSDSRRVLR